MTRVAIYARYSSDLQSAASIEDQVRLCRERIARETWLLSDTFADHAVSGGSMRTRPGLLALMAAARGGEVDVVLSEALDRLSRDQEDIAGIFKRLSHSGVRLITLSEGEISELHIGLKGTMNALYLKDLAQKTRRGLRGRVEAGRSGGGNSYGYRVVRRLLANGAPATGEREIDPSEARVVRRIFSEYISGLSPRQIAARLNAEGIAGPRGGTWTASTIHGSRKRRNGILNNELYLGRMVWNRQRFVKDPDSGKRVSRLNPREDWVTTEVPALRLIDDDTFARVQDLKSRFTGWAGNKRQVKKRLFTGLVTCSRCGGTMTTNRDRYYCGARRERGTCGATHGIAVAELEARVLGGLTRLLVGNEAALMAFVDEFQRELERLTAERRGAGQDLRRQLAEVDRGISRCMEFIVSGDDTPGAVRGKLTELEARKARLTAELAGIERAAPKVTIHPNLPDLYRRRVTALATLLEDEAGRAEAVAALRGLVERIEVGVGETRGRCTVTIHGGLAGVLAFCADPGQSSGGTEFLVAGAGFEPAAFRL
ncbi:recombinase family protein [Rhodobacter sp. Har01]|uniref:recombinase family protein n=1 Tax=Rhodobacter sp. Har01 TaxID=2883999 RepID=UPI001D080792|nr:recombinase family protein [Rhodobacter sp. Har01]MCB6180203.1 recombinase family protein [Rhodobacter sp. Har01]